MTFLLRITKLSPASVSLAGPDFVQRLDPHTTFPGRMYKFLFGTLRLSVVFGIARESDWDKQTESEAT